MTGDFSHVTDRSVIRDDAASLKSSLKTPHDQFLARLAQDGHELA